MIGRSGRLLIISAALLWLCGCNNQRAIRRVADSLIVQPDPTVELLESELRWMEDNLYHLDAQLETCLRQLESAKRNNAALRLELAEREPQEAPRAASPASSPKASQPSREPLKYDEELGTDDEDLLDFTPKIELGESASSPSEPGPTNDSAERIELPEDPIAVPGAEVLPIPQGDPPLIEPSGNPFLDDESREGETPALEFGSDPESGQVIRIQLNDRLTGGYNSDRQMGHDGVLVVIEPMDAWANYVPQAGAVTVELRDPQQPGVTGLVGKWSFTKSEVAAKIKKTLLGDGIHLELPWPNGSPTAKKLKLAVQYQSDQGNTLRASREILIEPTTSALVTQADAAEQSSWYRDRSRTATRWQPTR